ncbi:VOC family protein [Blastococcus sp. TF02A_35]|uniref:VOC family protein n=1 Tax=Blastococcus sp. TF02A-35 TaxID=2559612 RepID=UPI001ADDE276|nr:VOC family protein [Blastococcus sp. TF02A_35]
MDITIHQTFLPAPDPEPSLAFYRDAVGLELLNDVGYDGMRWLTLGAPGGAGTQLVLYPPAADPGVTEEEQRTIAEMMAKGTFASLILATTDLDAAFDAIQATGAEVMQEPAQQPYGVRDCAFRDPAGNTVRIQELR